MNDLLAETMIVIKRILHIALFFVFLSIFSVKIIHGQTTEIDTTQTKGPVAWKAALLSTALPGSGQIYNKKYWKVPLVYTAIGSFLYLVGDFNNKYQYYRDAYAATKYCAGPTDFYYDERYEGWTKEDRANSYEKYKDRFRRYRDLNAILLTAFYILNIVDASVDAHFSRYDIGKGLTFNVRPVVEPVFVTQIPENFVGIGCSLNF